MLVGKPKQRIPMPKRERARHHPTGIYFTTLDTREDLGCGNTALSCNCFHSTAISVTGHGSKGYFVCMLTAMLTAMRDFYN